MTGLLVDQLRAMADAFPDETAYVDLDTTALRAHFVASPGKTIYALLEHSRVDSLRSLLPAGSHLETLSSVRENNKFVLVKLRIGRAAGS